MNGFIDWLEKLNERDSKVRAVLRRSLAFEPGAFIQAFPYVEPFVKDNDSDWRRKVLYLVAGLWATHFRQDRDRATLSIARACGVYQATSGSTSVERRFINVLDADGDQLPHRLRQLVALLTEQSIDFDELLNGLLYWQDSRKGTQNKWAREFYRTLNNESETTSHEERI